MPEPHRRHRPPNRFPATRGIAVALLAATLNMGTAPVRADEPTASPTTAMLMLFRVDEQLSVQVKGAFERRCARYPVEQRELCGTAASEFVRDMKSDEFARLMTPFFDRNFDVSEIQAITAFLASRLPGFRATMPRRAVFTTRAWQSGGNSAIDGAWPPY
jgi:hypothetical protein